MASGAGGEIDGTDEVQRFAETLGLGDEAMTCQPESAEPALTALDPSGR